MVAATAAAPKLLRYSSTSGSNTRPANKFMGSAKFAIPIPDCFSSSRARGSFPIRALDSQRQEEEEDEEEENSSNLNNTTGFNSQEIISLSSFTSIFGLWNDLEYLGKLLAGSIVGGAVIKYGSIVFPEITRPNILLALIMIFTPVIIATLLLIKQSRVN